MCNQKKILVSNPNPIHRDVFGKDPRITWSFEDWWNHMEMDHEQVQAMMVDECMPGQSDLLLKHFCMLAWLHAQGRTRFDDQDRKDGEPRSPVMEFEE